MSESTKTAVPVEVQPVLRPNTKGYASLEHVPLYATASPAVQALLRADMAFCVQAGQIPALEYLDGLDQWSEGGTAAEYLAENIGSQDYPVTAEMLAAAAPQSAKTAVPVQAPGHFTAVAAKLLPWWAEATPVQQQLVLADMAVADLPAEDYCADPMPLAEHLATVLEHAEEYGIAVPPEAKAWTWAALQDASQRTPETILAETVEQNKAEQRTAAAVQKRAALTLDKCGLAYQRGERSYAKALLLAGKLAHRYTILRLSLPNGKRSVAIQGVEGELAKYASSKVDANELIQAYHAWHLLCDQPGIAADLPYGHYAKAWSRLVERAAKDTPQEHWVLLPGVETECLDVFRQAVGNSLKLEEAKEAALGVVAKQALVVAAAAAAAAELAKAALETSKANAETLRVQTLAALSTWEQAQAKAKAAPEADRPALEQLASEAEAAYKTVQAQYTAAKAEVDKLERASGKATKTAGAKADDAGKASTKAGNAGKGKAKPEKSDKPAQPVNVPNPVAAAIAQGAKVAADMALELITGTDKPDDTLLALLEMCSNHAQLSAKARRSVDAAIAVLTRQDKPHTQPSANGLAHAAA